MKTEERIQEEADRCRRFAEQLCSPADPKSVESVIEAMVRKQRFIVRAEALEWVLS